MNQQRKRFYIESVPGATFTFIGPGEPSQQMLEAIEALAKSAYNMDFMRFPIKEPEDEIFKATVEIKFDDNAK